MTQTTCKELEAENALLSQRVAELERERNEERNNYQWMKDLFEQSAVPVCLWEGDNLVYKYANNAYMHRTTQFDVIGKPIRDVFDDDQIPGLLDVLVHVYTSGQCHVASEALVRLKNVDTGVLEDAWYNLLFNPVRNTQGSVIGVSLFALEVTEQVKARQALHQQAQILNQVRGSVIVTDMQGAIISWNQESTSIFGYAPEEMIGQPISQLYPPENHEWLVNEVIIPLQERGELEFEATGCKKNGERFPFQVSLSLLHDDIGTPIGMIGYSIDITDRKLAEKDLRMIQFAMDHAPDSIHWIAMDGTIVYVNDMACTMLGYTREEIVGRSIIDLDPLVNEEQFQLLWEEAQQYGIMRFESVHAHKNGYHIPVEVVSNYLKFPGVEYSCVFTRDIAERKQAEAERTALQEQIIEAQRVALLELSAPLLPISTDTVVVPLIGTIDSNRAQQIMESLLEGIARYRANTAIIDITGVQVVDTQVGNTLIQAAQAARLLGAQVILTGIGSSMAQTLVHLGVELNTIVTRGNLQAGIAYALHRSPPTLNGKRKTNDL